MLITMICILPLFKKRKEKEIVDDKYENDFISLDDVISQNHYVGIKGREK